MKPISPLLPIEERIREAGAERSVAFGYSIADALLALFSPSVPRSGIDRRHKLGMLFSRVPTHR